MIRINSIKIEIFTSKGIYGAFESFGDGLNIIKANNSSGKSTLLQCVMYSLGLEELLGGRNEKAMQSVLKDFIEAADEKIPVIESYVFCEITNGINTITIKRAVTSPNKNSKLVEVSEHNGILGNEGKDQLLPPKQMYLHDAGSAKDSEYGFHMFLENFLDWSIPEVNFVDDSKRKLYVQSIFASFIIEQKKGWSDFLATIPYFGIKSVENRVIEFILKLDSYFLSNRKSELKQQLKDIETKWFLNWEYFKSMLQRGALSSQSINDFPHAVLIASEIKIYYITPEGNLTFDDFLDGLSNKFDLIKERDLTKVGGAGQEKQDRLKELTEKLNRYTLSHDKLNNEIFTERKKIENLYKQLTQIETDVSKNNSIAKIARLGGVLNLNISQSNCPTCHQNIQDTLLPQDIKQEPMLIEDNIEYLKAQKNLVKAFINSNKQYLLDREDRQEKYHFQIDLIRSEIKSLKKELIADDRLPSIADIEARLELQKKIEFYNKLKVELNEYKNKFLKLSKQWLDIQSELKGLPASPFSVKDNEKLLYLSNELKRLLTKFHYSSKSIIEVSISRDKFIPTIDNYNIRFDSSASDLIRAIWSYTCALYKTSEKFQGNHPQLMIFDEPGQHSMSDNDLRFFFEELSGYSCQSIVAASFNNDPLIYNATTQGLTFRLISFEGKLIQRIDSQKSLN